jgi:hypothetical protein
MTINLFILIACFVFIAFRFRFVVQKFLQFLHNKYRNVRASHDLREIDFVIVMKEKGLIIKAVLQAIDQLYSPRRIVIVTNTKQLKLSEQKRNHRLSDDVKTPIEYIDEELFFGKNLSKTVLNRYFDECVAHNNGDHREFGWWYQQLLKLGCHEVIHGLSELYVVWDADLIPITRWPLIVDGRACTAILQDKSRSVFNEEQYAASTHSLTDMTALRPLDSGRGGIVEKSDDKSIGTFISHHMVFKKKYVTELLALIARRGECSHDCKTWQHAILKQSRLFFRVSEYKMYQTFCATVYADMHQYHPYAKYGEADTRFRDGGVFLERLTKAYDLSKPLSYADVKAFVAAQTGDNNGTDKGKYLFKRTPHYVLIDHV